MIHGQRPARSAREQFDRQASHYNAQWNTWSEETLNWLLDHAECGPQDRVLDVATGTGFTALAFAPRVASVVGLDVSPGMLAQARRRAAELGLANVAFQEGTSEALPFPDAHFDLVTCRIAPHHFLDVTAFAREVARVLRAQGRFLLADTSVPDDDPEAGAWQNAVEALRDPSHVRNYTPREWRRLLEEAGLTVVHLSDTASITITLNDWIVKAGCTPEQAEAVRQQFLQAPAVAVRAFRIGRLPEGDIGFTWHRVVACAQKQGKREEIEGKREKREQREVK